MRSNGGGDARSGPAARLRFSSSMLPDHAPTDTWERPALFRDKFDCAERDKYISAKRDWAIDTRASTRSSYTSLSNVGSSDSSARRRALGRHGTIHENGRYESGASRVLDISSHVRSPPENSKAERDFFSSPGGPSPGYSSSLSMEKSCKDLDGIHLRDVHLSPSKSRPASSPCFDTSPSFGSSTRLYGMQNGCDLREHERLKFSSSSFRDIRDKEKVWGRPEYHRRTHSLPKLDSPRHWSGGDGELFEGRIDRYGSGSSKDAAFSDVQSHSNKEHRYDWRTRDRGLFGGVSLRSACAPLCNSQVKIIDAAPAHLEERRPTSPPLPLAAQISFSNQAHLDLDTSSKKRPRLTWGQGLAKYEKEKIEEDHSAEAGQHGIVELHEDMHATSDCQSRLTENGSISPLHNQHCGREQDSCDSGVAQSGCDFERSSTPQDLAIGSSLGTHESLMIEHSEDQSKENVRKLSPNGSCSKKPPLAIAVPLQASILPEVQVFLSSYPRERPTVSKDFLTHHVEKVEQECDHLEKELIRLNQEQVEEIVSTYDASNLNIEVHEGESWDTSVSATETQLTHCKDSSAAVVTCAENFPLLPRDNAHVEVPEASECAQMPPKDSDESQCDIARNDVDDTVVGGATMSAVQLGELQCVGGHMGPDLEVMTSTEKDVGPAQLILLSNRYTAERSLASLAHLNSPKLSVILESGRLYSSPQEADVWRLNAESHSRKRKHLEAKVLEEKVEVKFLEKTLAVKYRGHRKVCQQRQGGSQVGMEWKKSIKNLMVEEKDDVNPMVLQSPLRCRLGSGPTNTVSKNEEVHLAKMCRTTLYNERERGFLKMPPMRPRGEKELHIFETKNGLVDDPIAAELERKSINPWSNEEKSLFLQNYSLFGKDFRRIASYLEHKTVADCVDFYYRNQKSEEFEKVHQKRRLEKRHSFQQENYNLEQFASFLATKRSANNRHCKEDFSCLEGLSLVAAAAAALSAPTKCSYGVSCLEGLSLVAAAAAAMSAPTKCSYGVLATQACIKVAPTQSVKGLRNVECKGAQIRHLRAKARSEERDVHWSDKETKTFLDAVVMFGKDFHSISQHLGTRSEWQCRSFFSKARRRLGLDQLVERHQVIVQTSRAEHVVSKLDASTNRTSPEVDSPQQQSIRANYSAACSESVVSAELLQVSGDSKDANASGLLHEICRGVCVSPRVSALESGTLTLCDQVKQETCTNSDSGEKGSGDVRNCARYTSSCHVSNAPSLDLACKETLQFKNAAVSVKAEPTHMADVFCNREFSESAPSAVSTSIPNPILVAPAVEATRNKDLTFRVPATKLRREPTSWTQEEKEKFVEVLKIYGKSWDRLRESLPGKSLAQIKTYFQNSKAKLGFGPEGVVGGNGRGTSLRKRKVDDSDSSSNVGSVPVQSDDGNIKVSPSLFVSTGGVGSYALAAELMYANGMNPLLNPAMFTYSSLQVPYGPPNPTKAQPAGLQQPQQPPSKSATQVPQELPLPAVQHLHKQCTLLQSEANQQTLLHQHQQLQQQVAEAVLKQPSLTHLLQGHMVPPQVPHTQLLQMLGQHQAQASHQTPNLIASQLSQGATQSTGGSQAVANNQQLQQQAELFASQLYQIHIPPPLLIQHQQLLQFHWQQQQAQLQHILAKQLRSQLPHVSSLNEQQQQLSVLNGIMQATSACTEALKHSGFDNLNIPNTQSSLCEVLHQLPSILQGTQVSNSLAVLENQTRAMDVKLFGQSLLSQPASSSGKVSTLSSQIAANLATLPPANDATQGPGWPHLVWPVAPSVNGCPSTGVSSGHVNSRNGGVKLESCNVQEGTDRTNEILSRRAKSNEDQQAYEGSSMAIRFAGEGADSRAMPNMLPDITRQPRDVDRPNSESSRSAQDCGTSVNKFRVQDSKPSPVASGGQGAFQSLPRVLDALVALAEWQIQNPNGSSGKDFLSQSWEALQRDPGSLVEAGKAFAQMYTAPDALS